MRIGGGETEDGRRKEARKGHKLQEREELQKLGQERRVKYWEDAAEKGGRAGAGA